MEAVPAVRLTDGVVVVRPPEERDVGALVAACADPEISRWTRVPSPYTPEDARRFLALAAADRAAGAGVASAVCAAGEDRLLGTIGLMGIDRQAGYGEIGYWMGAGARGRGLTTRAVVLVRDWAITELGLRELEILPHRDNAPSQRVAERAGFTATGAVRSVGRMPDGRRDGYLVYAWRA